MIDTLVDKRKRRFTRVSLRTLLIVMLAACIVLGWKVERVRRQREAVNLVLQMGGTVGYEYEGPFIDEPHGIAGPRLPKPAPEWLIKRLGIDFFDEVVSVDLPAKSVDLTQIRGLSALRRLDLNGAMRVSDVSPLIGLTQLEWLVLSGTDVSDLSPLKDMTQLKVLYLGHTQVVDIEPLQRLTQLRSLDLSGTHVTDISILETLTQLQVLSLWGTQVSDVSGLQGLEELTWLDLRGTKVSDLAPLREATGVQIIVDSNQDLRIPGELEGRVRRY